jgi:hypothetical protein
MRGSEIKVAFLIVQKQLKVFFPAALAVAFLLLNQSQGWRLHSGSVFDALEDIPQQI